MIRVLIALACTLVLAETAHAGTVMHDAGGNVVLDAAPGETNTVFVQSGNGGTVVINDATAPLQAWDDACAQLSDSMVECAAGAYVQLFLDDRNDRAAVDLFFTAGVFAYGEAGDDQLIGAPVVSGLDGGPGNDKLTGGEGHDVLHGGDGNDELSGLGGLRRALRTGGRRPRVRRLAQGARGRRRGRRPRRSTASSRTGTTSPTPRSISRWPAVPTTAGPVRVTTSATSNG